MLLQWRQPCRGWWLCPLCTVCTARTDCHAVDLPPLYLLLRAFPLPAVPSSVRPLLRLRLVPCCCCCCALDSCRKIKSVEFMVCDSVALVAGPLGLRDAICSDADLQAYLNLDDSLLQTIKMLVPEQHEKPSDVIKVTAAQNAAAAVDQRRMMFGCITQPVALVCCVARTHTHSCGR